MSRRPLRPRGLIIPGFASPEYCSKDLARAIDTELGIDFADIDIVSLREALKDIGKIEAILSEKGRTMVFSHSGGILPLSCALEGNKAKEPSLVIAGNPPYPREDGDLVIAGLAQMLECTGRAIVGPQRRRNVELMRGSLSTVFGDLALVPAIGGFSTRRFLEDCEERGIEAYATVAYDDLLYPEGLLHLPHNPRQVLGHEGGHLQLLREPLPIVRALGELIVANSPGCN
jgi:hypothetical protein